MTALLVLFALTAPALTPEASAAQPPMCVVTGTLETVSRDETDGSRFIGLLKDSTTRQTMFLAFPGKVFSPQFLQGLTGDKVEVSGTRNPGVTIKRPYLDFFIGIAGTNDVRVLRHIERKKSRTAPSLDDPPLSHLTIPRSGRRAAEGYVLAVWGRGRFLLRTESGETILVYHPAPSLPDAGDFVRCEGFPETDLFRLAIVCKTWKPIAPTFSLPHDPVIDLPPRRLFVGEDGSTVMTPDYYGKLIRLRGVISCPPFRSDAPSSSIRINADGCELELKAAHGINPFEALEPGTEISAVARCIFGSSFWHESFQIPQITQYIFIVSSESDVRVLSRPSWWTSGRLVVVISLMFALLVAIFAWNRVLQRSVTRKSLQLMREKTAQLKASLRVAERTRLAIELHDSLSQNLAAIACQVSATRSAVPIGPDETLGNLQTVERMLLSCRTELRRCLWDLRNDAFDKPNMADILRLVLGPVVGTAALRVRFNVPRARLGDSLIHAVTCVIRELASNAVRHGRATDLAVAGDLTDGILAFSVRDNGCGFDSSHCAGVADGHFGLEGIRERITRLGGTFSIGSSAGGGIHAKVTIPVKPGPGALP